MKKGFTLVEMLAVIVVLALIMTISIKSISAVRYTQLKKVAEEKVHNIEKAAIMYAQENPNLFDNEDNKCQNSRYNETTMPGISDYKDYDECIVIKAEELAVNNYLNTDFDNGTYILRNDLNGENMLTYGVAIYKNNNRINAFVSVHEIEDIAEGYISTQQLIPEGGIYSSCPSGYLKVLSKGSEDIYVCGRAVDPIKSTVVVDENNHKSIACTDYNTSLVFSDERYCCSNSSIFIDGKCVSTNSADTVATICSAGFSYSDNKNLCIKETTFAESRCVSGTKTFANGKYYCLITPTCEAGFTLSFDLRTCVKDSTVNLSTCPANTDKTYTNDKYYCLATPICDNNNDLSFDYNYCN